MRPRVRLTVGALSAIVAAAAMKNGWPASARSSDPSYLASPTYLQQQFPTPPTPQHPIFRAGATLVAVDVYPMTDGRTVEGLRPSDFDVKEDGKPQTVEFFEFLKFDANPVDADRRDPNTADEGDRLAADPHHRAFVAYFDTYHMTTWGARQMRQPVIDFLDRTIGSTDYFAAMNPDTRPNDLTFGQRTETIATEVGRYWPLAVVVDARSIPISEHEKFLQSCYQYRSPSVEADNEILRGAYARWRMDVVLKSLIGLVAKLATVREERTNVLVLSDGWALDGPDAELTVGLWNAPRVPELRAGVLYPGRTPTSGAPPDAQACDAELGRLAAIDFADDFHRLAGEALRKNVAFFPVSPGGLEALDDHLMQTQGRPPSYNESVATLDTLRSLASATNGRSIAETNDIRTPMRQLADAFGSYYLLGYYTTNPTLDGKYRTIDVKVKAPGVKVTARHGYIASPNPVLTSTRVDDAGPSPEAAALGALSALESEPALMATGNATGGDLVVVAEVAGARMAAIGDGADVRVTVTGAAGAAPIMATGHIEKGARSAIVRVPVGALTGPWRVQIDVGAPADDISTSVTVPTAGATMVGEPVLYRATPSPRSPLWPSASHVFSRTERIHAEWPTAGPLDSHTARLLDRRGQPLAVGVSLTEPPNATRPTLVGDVSLGPLAPGDYLLELVAGRAGATERRLTAFRVGP